MTGPTKNELHERAATSARETRASIIRLATAFIGGLVFVTARGFDPPMDGGQKGVIFVALVLMGVAFVLGIFLAWADAQWSYAWGVELDEGRDADIRSLARSEKLVWHSRKAWAEKTMLTGFIVGVAFCVIFVVLRCI